MKQATDDENFIHAYLGDIESCIYSFSFTALSEASDALYAAWKDGKPVLFCGNGGSGASCSHIVNDLQKNIGIDHSKPLKALCLSDASALVSAWANDSHWQNVFEPQVNCWAEPGSVVVGVSGSGNSANVLLAVNAANHSGCTTIGLTGFDGGKLKEMASISLHVQTESMQQAEDVHMILLHLLFLMLGRRIEANA